MKPKRKKSLLLILSLTLAGVLLVAAGESLAQSYAGADTVTYRGMVKFLSPKNRLDLPAQMRFFEASNSAGNEYVGWRAPFNISASYTLIWPAVPPTAGQILQAANGDSIVWGSTGAGDITGVVAGVGLADGGLSGDVTLNVIYAATAGNADTLTLHDFVTGTPSANTFIKWNGANWVTAAAGGTIIGREVDGSPSVAALSTLEFLQSTGLKFTDQGSNVGRVEIDTSTVWINTKTEIAAQIASAISAYQQDSDTTGFDASKTWVLSKNYLVAADIAAKQDDADTLTWDATKTYVNSRGFLTTETGDISAVTAGYGLAGGGSSGAVTLTVDSTTVYLQTKTENNALYVPLGRTITAGNGLVGGSSLNANITLDAIGSDGIKADTDTLRAILTSTAGMLIKAGVGAIDSLELKLDGSTLSKSTAGVKVNAIGSAEITNGAILNEDINASAAIALSKIASSNAGRLVITSGGTIAERAALTASALVVGDVSNGVASLALGTANRVVGMNSGATANEYKDVLGTSNRVTVTHGANSITLNAPQDLHTAALNQFGRTILDSLRFTGVNRISANNDTLYFYRKSDGAFQFKLFLGDVPATDEVLKISAGRIASWQADAVSGGAGGYATIQEEGSGLTQRGTLNFIGSGLTAADNSGSSRTDVTVDADLNALASNSTDGLWAHTGSGTGAARTLSGTAGAVSITNGDGVSGNPTFTLPSAITVPTSYAIGSDPADAGVIRLENAAVIGWEASPAGTDVTLTVDASEVMQASGTFNAVTLTENGNGITNNADALGGDLSGNLPNPSVTDDSHAHTGSTLSGIDVSDDLNLVAGTNITLTGDQLDVDDAFVLNTGDAIAGDLNFSDGATDSPKAVFTPQTGTAFSLFVADSDDDLRLEANTGSTERFEITNTGAGVLDVDIDGSLTAGNLSGTNSGDVTLAGENYLSISSQQITANAVNLSGSHVTGTLAAGRFGALTGDVTNSAGSYATTIANDAVTYAKMQNISATQRVLGRNSSGSGDTEEVTLSQLLDWIGSAAQGDILYRGASGWSRLGAGTSGQVLHTQGAGANPIWDTDDGAGGGAPTDVQYLVLALSGSLSQERVIVGATNNISLNDGGANGNLTIGLAATLDFAAKVVINDTLMVAEGATANGFETHFTIDDPTADREINWPDADGEVTVLGNSSTGTGGVVREGSPTITTPTIADLTNMNHIHQGVTSGGYFVGNSFIRAQNNTDAASNQVAQFQSGDRATAADDDEGYLSFYNDNDGGTQTEFSRLSWLATDVTAATKDAAFTFDIMSANSLTEALRIQSSAAGTITVNVPNGTLQQGGTAVTLQDRTITVAGTTNEITSSAGAQDLSVNRTWTLSLPATIDLGGKTSFEIPNAAAPTTDAFGEIAGDDNAYATGRGAAQFYDGTTSTWLVGFPTTETKTDGYIPKYIAATGRWRLAPDSTTAGGGTAWDAIADAAGLGSISFAGFDQDITSAEDGGDILTITNSDADRASDSNILVLADNDGGDANAFYLRMIGDADGTPTNDYLFSQTSFSVGAGIAATFASATSLTIPNGTNPTVSAAGQISVDNEGTTESALRFYADAEYSLPARQTKSFTIVSPIATDDYPVWRVPYAVTIRAIHVLCVGGTNIVGGLDEADGNGGSSVAIDADITSSAGTNANDDGSLTNPTLDAGDYLMWHTTSISGTPTSVTITFEYTVDPVN